MKKTVLVTGAGRGIGRAIARKLALEGYDLILLTATGKSRAELLADTALTGRLVEAVAFDLADAGAVRAFTARVERDLWGIVNNAGICRTLRLEEQGDDPWTQVIGTNLEGTYRLTKGLLPRLGKPGRIVNISSQLGVEGRAAYSAYCASKFALIGLTRCWAKELGAGGVTVNAVCPGWVDTEMSRRDMARLAQEAGVSQQAYYAGICAPLELKRFNSPEEVAAFVSFLLSEQASGITGRELLMQTVWNQE